jgi:adenylate cyclase
MTATILVVDDEPDLEALVLQKFRWQIRDGAVTFMFAHDGIEALQSLEQNPHVALIVLDINMPRMDGLSLLQKLQEADDKKSTVIVTAYGDMRNIRTAMNRGAFDFLTKPIDFTDLQMTIEKTLHHVEMMGEYRRRQVQAERARESLKRFLPPQLAELIVSSEELLESHRRKITVVFCDLRGFTAFSETAEPEEVMGVLQEYYAAMWRLISQFEGTLEHIAGDGLMVFFNDPMPCPDASARAVRMAVAMRQSMEELGQAWAKLGYKLDFGIGIAEGYATLGKIGFAGQFNYSAVGSVTNLAARLCAEALGRQILISQRVYASVNHLVEVEPVPGEFLLKGFLKPVQAYNVLALKES